MVGPVENRIDAYRENYVSTLLFEKEANVTVIIMFSAHHFYLCTKQFVEDLRHSFFMPGFFVSFITSI